MWKFIACMALFAGIMFLLIAAEDREAPTCARGSVEALMTSCTVRP